MSNILIYTAVPFSLGRMQSVGRVALRGCVDVCNKQSSATYDGQTCGKRKRIRLTHLTPEEKHFRRKLMCREASQKSRDAVNSRLNILQKKVQQLKKERDTLLVENKTLKENHKQLTSENKTLQATYLGCSIVSGSTHGEDASSEKLLKAGECAVTVPESLDINKDRRSLGYAWFINTPLLKGQDLHQFFILMTMMALTELLSASFPQVTTKVLIRDLAAMCHPIISSVTSGIIQTVMNSMFLPLNYHKTWT